MIKEPEIGVHENEHVRLLNIVYPRELRQSVDALVRAVIASGAFYQSLHSGPPAVGPARVSLTLSQDKFLIAYSAADAFLSGFRKLLAEHRAVADVDPSPAPGAK